MPSWSHNLSEDHRWTGRRLIGHEASSDDGCDEDFGLLFRDKRKRNGHVFWDESFGDTGQNQNGEHDGDEDSQQQSYTIPSSSLSRLSRESQIFVTSGDLQKRTLLTLEEMEDSDEYNGEWENDSNSYPSEDKSLSNPRSLEGMVSNERHDVERQKEDEFTQEDLITPPSERQKAANTLDSGNCASSAARGSQPSQEESTPCTSTIDSGSMRESAPGVLPDPSSKEILACKRRKKAIKYLEHIVLDLLRQILAITRLELRNVRSEIGEGEASEAEEDEEREEEGRANIDPSGENPAVGDDEGKGIPNLCVPLLNRATGNLKYLRYPGRPGQSDTSALALARLLRVCELLHSALVEDVAVTKRDIYYKDVNLFGKQSVVDALIDDIVASAGLKRMDFNVVASPKGLVASSGLKLILRNDETNLISSVPTIIPTNGDMVEIQCQSSPRWALVIEKEATFTTLCKSGILADEELLAGVLITGKGYPDLATLHFLKLLSDTFPACTIAVLVDADPHGLDILSVYRYGSKTMRFTAEAEGLALGAKVEWLGVKATEWSQFVTLLSGLLTHKSHSLKLFDMYRLGIDMDKLIPISEKDVQFAGSMLQEDDLPIEWKRELIHMLHIRRKAEIQILGGDATAPKRFDGKESHGDQVEADACQGSSRKKDVEALSSASDRSTKEELYRTNYVSDVTTEPAESDNAQGVLRGHGQLYNYVKAKLCRMLLEASKNRDQMDI